MANRCKSHLGEFATQTEAAKAHGVSFQAINYHLERYGHLDRIGTVPRPLPKPTEFDGVLYPSLGSLARALGVQSYVVERLARSGRLHEISRKPSQTP